MVNSKPARRITLEEVGKDSERMICEMHETWLIQNAGGEWICPVCTVADRLIRGLVTGIEPGGGYD